MQSLHQRSAFRFALNALSAAAIAACVPFSVMAQQNPGFFIPNHAAAPTAPRAAPQARPPSARAPAPAQQSLAPPPPLQVPNAFAPAPAPAGAGGFAGGDQGADQPVAQVPAGPIPDLPALPKGATPPAAVVGVLGVPDIMRAATAAQQVERTIGERREKLNQDAQKEQAAWRDLQQALSQQRASMSQEQVHAKERDLQDRITNAQKDFRDRNRIIQETAQYCLGQIERTLIGVIRQVAESRGMNLVLHRSQVALNVNEFDITDQVTEQMNKVMPTITIPPDGVSPVAQAAAAAAAAAPKATTPVAAPSTPPATRR